MFYSFMLTGDTPFLMHADDIEKNDALRAWRMDPANKSVSVPGDDRSPPWSWSTYVYEDGKKLVLPTELIMAALRKAAAQIKLKGNTTFMALSQSALHVVEEFCDFRCDGRTILMADVNKFLGKSFAEQSAAVQKLGFKLFVKRASMGSTKNIRVRPRFDVWSVSGTIGVNDPAITPEVLLQMFKIAGRIAGVGDWRPNSKKPGPYGLFSATLEVLEGEEGIAA